MTNERNVCAFCKYFEKAYPYLDEMDRCTYRNIPMHEDCTCLKFTSKHSTDSSKHSVNSEREVFYTDINDELDYDEQGNTDDDSFESSVY